MLSKRPPKGSVGRGSALRGMYVTHESQAPSLIQQDGQRDEGNGHAPSGGELQAAHSQVEALSNPSINSMAEGGAQFSVNSRLRLKIIEIRGNTGGSRTVCAVKYIRSLDALMACSLPPPPVDETLQMLPDACTNTLHRAARKIY